MKVKLIEIRDVLNRGLLCDVTISDTKPEPRCMSLISQKHSCLRTALNLIDNMIDSINKVKCHSCWGNGGFYEDSIALSQGSEWTECNRCHGKGYILVQEDVS